MTSGMKDEASLQSYMDLCTEFYDIDKPDAPPVPLAYYRNLIARTGGPVLEAMCGSGRFLLPLLGDGIDIDGLDASPQMLRACDEKLKAAGLETTIYRQFLHQLDVTRDYNLALITAGSFSLISDPDDALESLRRIHDCLSPGGEILIEACTSQNRPGIERFQGGGRWSGKWVTREDGSRIVFSDLSTFDPERNVVESIMKYELFAGSELLKTEMEFMELKLHDPESLAASVIAAGFQEPACLSPTDFGEPRPDDPMVAIHARKPLT